MDRTSWILLLIATWAAVHVGAFIWQARRRSAETEMIRAALYATANSIRYFRGNEPIQVTFDPSVNKAIERVSKTAIDIQGMIELQARHLVSQMPPETIAEMGVPEDWATAESNGS